MLRIDFSRLVWYRLVQFLIIQKMNFLEMLHIVWFWHLGSIFRTHFCSFHILRHSTIYKEKCKSLVCCFSISRRDVSFFRLFFISLLVITTHNLLDYFFLRQFIFSDFKIYFMKNDRERACNRKNYKLSFFLSNL